MKYSENSVEFWLAQADLVECQQFRDDDPITIPHRYRKADDQAIAGFFAALLAWGQRPVIIRNALHLMEAMDNAPDAFVRGHTESDLKPLLGFVHRTFNDTDLLFFLNRLKHLLSEFGSLEAAFFSGLNPLEMDVVRQALVLFHERVFAPDWSPSRTRKHVATPARGSACKRLNMFLRWMVRSPERGVDFGIWNSVAASKLFLPLDLHVGRTARKYGLLERTQDDWKSVELITHWARCICPEDPVRLDFALYGMSLLKLQDMKGI